MVQKSHFNGSVNLWQSFEDECGPVTHLRCIRSKFTEAMLHFFGGGGNLVTELVKKFPTFYGNRMFIIMFSKACQLILTWARCIQSILSYPVLSKWSSLAF
jgi:hypothetical protein